jgi:hypothetical protein
MNRIDFDRIEWSSPMPHLRHKVYECDGRRLRLLELDSDFVEPDWCMRGHIGSVLRGKMEITFAEHAETFVEGDGIFIPPGEPGKHRSKVLTDRVILILVEDV